MMLSLFLLIASAGSTMQIELDVAIAALARKTEAQGVTTEERWREVCEWIASRSELGNVSTSTNRFRSGLLELTLTKEPVIGSDDVFMLRVDVSGRTRAVGHLDRAARIVVWNEKGERRTQALMDRGAIGAEYMNLGSTAMLGERLVVLGTLDNGSNVPLSGFSVFERSGSKWVLSQTYRTERESFIELPEAVDELKRQTVVSGSQGRHLSSAHAGPHVTYQETWIWTGARYHVTQPVRIDTPYARLDDIVGAVLNDDSQTARKLGATKNLVERLEGMRGNRYLDVREDGGCFVLGLDFELGSALRVRVSKIERRWTADIVAD